jgi:hypothetical protein
MGAMRDFGLAFIDLAVARKNYSPTNCRNHRCSGRPPRLAPRHHPRPPRPSARVLFAENLRLHPGGFAKHLLLGESMLSPFSE